MVGRGDITLSEFSEFSEQIWHAKTRAELDAIFAELRRTHSANVVAVGPKPAIREVSTGRTQSWFGDLNRRGRWDASGGVDILAVCGDVLLDLREALINSDATTVKVSTVMGDVRLVVPPGVRVEVSGSRILGDLSLDDGNYAAPYGPLIRLRADTVAGDVKVRVLAVGEKIPSMWKWF